MAQVNGLVFYQRSIDCGNGYQIVTVKDGVIEAQSLESNGHHYYTGDGNPELVGQPVAALRGMGFKKIDDRGGELSRYSRLVDAYYEQEEYAY